MKHFAKILALLLAIVMVVGMLPTVAFAAEAKGNSWERIYAYQDKVFKSKRNANQEITYEDYCAIAGDLAEIVKDSDDYVEGSCTYDPDSGNATFFWDTKDGEAHGYSPTLSARLNGKEIVDPDTVNVSETKSFAKRGGSPTGGAKDVYVIGPWYGSDSSFTDQYKNEGQSIAAATGGTYTLYSTTSATVDNVANAIQSGAVVIFDSHGVTDYDNALSYSYGGDYVYDSVTQANTSYLTLTNNTGWTSEDKATVTGTYGSYKHAYSFQSTSGTCYCVDGTAIANHMSGTAPHNMVWMAICLGMATSGLQAPLRDKGVEVVYGYSQSVSFNGDYEWESEFWSKMKGGQNVATAFNYMTSQTGGYGAKWDYSNDSDTDTIGEARYYMCAFPNVVSSEDTYQGQRSTNPSSKTAANSQTYNASYGACNIQTVNSTWKLMGDPEPATVTLMAGSSQYGSTISTTTNTATTLPSYSGTVPTGYTFAGWTDAAISGTTSTSPTLYNGTFTPSATTTTLYACFSKEESGGSGTGEWTLLESDSNLSAGMTVVFASNASGKTAGDISSQIMASVDSTFASGYGTITSLGNDTVQMTVGGSSGAWTFANGSGQLLGATAVKKVAWGSGTTTWDVSISSGAATIQSTTSSYGRFLYNTGSPRFTTYTSNTSASMLLPQIYYMDGTGSTYSYTTDVTVCNHNYQVTDSVAATCTDTGLVEYTCSLCGNSYIEETAALGHTYGAWSSNNNGTHSRTCSVCSNVETADCSYTSSTSGTTTTFTCSVCAYSYQTQLATYTVTYNDLGTTTTVDCIEGNSVTLPATGSTVEGYTFAGWVAAAIGTETTTAPTVLTGSYAPSANVTLYALYTRSEAGSGSGDYVKVTSDAGLTSGQYLIVNESAGRAMDASKESTIGSGTNFIEVTVSNDTIASTSTVDASAFTFDATANTFATPGGLYICRTSGTSGGAVTTSSTASSAANTISISDGNATVQCGSYYLRYNTSGYFRYYTSASQQAIQLYKQDGAGSTTYYTTSPVAQTVCEHTNTTLTGAVAATCTTAGYTGDVVCDDCGVTVTAGSAIAALGHDWVAGTVVAATCTEAGYTPYTCSRCSETKQEAIPATGHTDANSDNVCDVCGADLSTPAVTSGWYLVDDYTNLEDGVYAIISPNNYAFNGTITSGHGQKTDDAFSWDANGYSATAPTGTLELTFTSTANGFTLYNETLGYLYASKASSGGLAFHASEDSGWSFSEEGGLYAANSAHLRSYNDTFRTYGNNSNNTIGLAHKVEGAAHEHTPENVAAVPATCTTAGATAGTVCSICGAVLSGCEEVAALGHDWVAGTVVAATCTEAGYTPYTCSRCSETKQEAIPATGHVDANSDDVCDVCGADLSTPAEPDYSGDYYIAAIRTTGNYQWMTSDLGTASTKRYQAEDSGLDTLPAAITSDVDAAKTWTLAKQQDGTYLLSSGGSYSTWTSGNSANLGETGIAITVTANGDAVQMTISDGARYLSLNSTATNNYFAYYGGTQINDLYLVPVNGEVPTPATHTATYFAGQAATCTEAGVSAYWYCAECLEDTTGEHYGKAYSDEGMTTEIADTVIAALGHNLVAGTVHAPSCTEEGYTEYACSRCDYTTIDDIVAATGHTSSYVDNGDGTHDEVCSVCSTVLTDNEAHVYVDGTCVCGATEPVADPNLVPELQFSSITLNIQSYIGVDFGVRTGGKSSVVKDYDSFYAVISVGSNDAVTYTSSDFIAYSANLGYFELKSDGTQMTETITATLYAVKNGVTYHGNAVTYSVRSGLMENIASAKAADLTVERNRQYYTMLVDMLNYGAQAQLYFNNRTDDLANSELTSADQAYATSANPTFTETASTSGTGAVTFKNFNLAVGSTIELNASITITGSGYAPTDLEAHITYGDTTEVVDCFGTGSKTAYMIYNTLPVTETRTPLTITIHAKNGGACVSNTWTGSLAALVPSIMSSTPEAVNLLNAMMKYADSCALYFN